MYGRVDRGGSREGKKSLRKNKIAIVEKVKNWGKPEHESRPAKSVPGMFSLTPLLLCACKCNGLCLESQEGRFSRHSNFQMQT
jgi:hypothetical protein